MSFILVPILTFIAVMAIGGALLIARNARRRQLQQRLGVLDEVQDGGGAVRGGEGLVHVVSKIGKSVSQGGPSATLKEQLARAGYHGPGAASVYMGLKIVLLIVGLCGTCGLLVVLGAPVYWCVLMAFMVGGLLSFLPNIMVSARRRKRSSEVRHHLPDTVDLLEVCVSSGMGVDMAWNVVAEEIRRVSGVLADEMALTNLEIHLGSPRALAMRHLADRTGAEDIRSLVAVLTQSERFGTSIADALRTFSSSMREARSMRAQENAERMSVIMLFPMVLLLLPAYLIVLAGPAFIKWFQIIHG